MYAVPPPLTWGNVFATFLFVAGMLVVFYFTGFIGWLIYIWLVDWLREQLR